MRMYVYLRPLTRRTAPIVVETNLRWALPYWQARKQLNPNITWSIR